MRILIFILVSFSTFSQVDTIQPPCNLTRQQTRLWYKLRSEVVELEETKSKLFDKQHERENTKEIKSLRYGYRSLKVENETIRKNFKFREDSIKRSNALLRQQERNRNSEAEKSLKSKNKQLQNEFKILKKQERKKVNPNIVWIICGIAVFLILILVILLVRRSK